MASERRKIRGEIARLCGWNNAMFDCEIDTATNKVRYRVCSHVSGVGSRERFFADYAEAARVFEDTCAAIFAADGKERVA